MNIFRKISKKDKYQQIKEQIKKYVNEGKLIDARKLVDDNDFSEEKWSELYKLYWEQVYCKHNENISKEKQLSMKKDIK